MWYRDRFAWEYKGKGRDLDAAYHQLQLYREDLENPPLLVVCDMHSYRVHTNFTRTRKVVHEFTNEEIGRSDPAAIRVLRALFEDPDILRPGQTVESVTEEAARKFGRLADGLRERGVDSLRAAHFLNKLLFCLFAEDVGLLPKGLFARLAERTRRQPERFATYARQLFGAMEGGGDFLLEDIRCFNGGLFADDEVVALTAEEIGVLAEATRLDWASVEPAIFGTLFERSLNPAQRAKLGAHYTSREDILAIVEPVLMQPLRREWEQVRHEVEGLSQKVVSTGHRAAGRIQRDMESKLQAFARRLREVRVLDPACGSGNFLYVSLRELLELEKEVSAFATKQGLTSFFTEVGPDQLFGIETDAYAHELAQVVIWIGYLQWTLENRLGIQEPILGPMTNIKHIDAIMERGEEGEPREPEWPEAEVIVGNPPFLGDRRMRSELGHNYVEELRKLYAGRVPGGADLVTYWFERSRERIESDQIRRAGLLATNSIRGGANRRVLQRIKDSGDVFFAESDRPWILDGAAVRVSIVGFDDGAEVERSLDGTSVETINSDLTGTADLTRAKKLSENTGIAFYGTVKIGPFVLERSAAKRMLSSVGNPNGRANSDVVKPWMNADAYPLTSGR